MTFPSRRIALVTGGSRGIGAGIVRRLAAAGAIVVINFATDIDSAAQLSASLEASGHRASLRRADVTDAAEVGSMVHETVREFGGVDILVNCAGINIDRAILDMTEEEWDRVVDVNLKGTFLVSQAVAPFLLRRGEGKIVNIAAATAYSGRAQGANYCAAKAGVVALTKCLALELAPQIQVNAIVPGLIETEETVRRLGLGDASVLGRRLSGIPAGRLGNAEDVAAAVEFLTVGDSSYITGQAVWVNGGAMMWT